LESGGLFVQSIIQVLGRNTGTSFGNVCIMQATQKSTNRQKRQFRRSLSLFSASFGSKNVRNPRNFFKLAEKYL
jgi:hypothetical protein